MFNKVILIGNITRDIELRYTQGGSAIAKFSLAINRTWKDRNTGEKREEVCYVDINIFGKAAENANQYLAKGKKVLIEGRLQFEQWQDQQGQKRSKHSISAESFQFMDSKGDNQVTAQKQREGIDSYTSSKGQAPNAQTQYNDPLAAEYRKQDNSRNNNNSQIEIDDSEIPFN